MRHIQILNMLNDTHRITAQELAEHFEVSKRTILRDIDSLLGQGYPIQTHYGRYGGFSFEEGYTFRLDTLTKTQYQRLSQLADVLALHPEDEKLRTLIPGNSWIEYDVSSWGAEDKELFRDIEYAIHHQMSFEFRYFNAQGNESQRNVIPRKLQFKDRYWFLIADDQGKEKMFKLKRMMRDTKSNKVPSDAIICEVLVSKSRIFKILDECLLLEMKDTDGEGVYIKFAVLYSEWIYDFILSFGHELRVLSPVWLVEAITNRIQAMQNLY